jgi:6,7-dimethyl-8-ribityllumazine synthase
MARIIEGKLDAKGQKIGIVISRFNSFICERLLEGAMDALVRHGAEEKDIEIVRVPGAFEIPLAAKKMVGSGRYDGLVCLGAVIRGSTPHFDYVCAEVSKGIAAISLDAAMPVGFGVLTTDTIEQAIERAGSKAGNKGAEAAMAVVEMLNVFKAL